MRTRPRGPASAPRHALLGLSLALLALGCTEQLGLSVRLPDSALDGDGALSADLALRVELYAGGTCPAEPTALDELGEPTLVAGAEPGVQLEDGDYAAVAIVRDEDCQVRYFGCTEVRPRDVSEIRIDAALFPAPLGCDANEVCSASQCLTPDLANPQDAVELCGFGPGEWRFGPAELDPRFTHTGISDRYPAIVELGGVARRFIARAYDHLGGQQSIFDITGEETAYAGFAGGTETGRLAHEPPDPATGADGFILMYSFVSGTRPSILQQPVDAAGDTYEHLLALEHITDRGWREPWSTDSGSVIWFVERAATDAPWEIRARRRVGRDLLAPLETVDTFDLSAVNGASDERAPTLNRPGTLLVFSSDRLGSYDLFMSLRVADAYSAPVRIDTLSDARQQDRDPFLYDTPGDDCGLYFVRDAADGVFNVYRAPVLPR